MPTLKTLGDIETQVLEISRGNHDHITPARSIDVVNLESIMISEQTGDEEYMLEEQAQRQFCARLGVPYSYLSPCPGDLQHYNLDYWLTPEKKRNAQYFLRFSGNDNIRALFTPKYKPADNTELVEALYKLGYTPEIEVKSYLDNKLLRIGIPNLEAPFVVGKDDTIYPGVSFVNSEIGISALKVEAFFLRLKCTNGMIGWSSMQVSHRHVTDGLIKQLPALIDHAKRSQSKTIEKFQISFRTPVPNPEQTFFSFNTRYQLTDRQRDAVTWAQTLEDPSTMFGVVQTYTRAASYPFCTSEDAYKMERVGGCILSLINPN